MNAKRTKIVTRKSLTVAYVVIRKNKYTKQVLFPNSLINKFEQTLQIFDFRKYCNRTNEPCGKAQLRHDLIAGTIQVRDINLVPRGAVLEISTPYWSLRVTFKWDTAPVSHTAWTFCV